MRILKKILTMILIFMLIMPSVNAGITAEYVPSGNTVQADELNYGSHYGISFEGNQYSSTYSIINTETLNNHGCQEYISNSIEEYMKSNTADSQNDMFKKINAWETTVNVTSEGKVKFNNKGRI